MGGHWKKRIRLLVVDHLRLFCDLLSVALGRCPRVEAFAALEDAEEAVGLAAGFRPHVVLMDIRLGCHRALAAAKAITVRSAESRVLFIDEAFCAPNVCKSWRAGGWGYWTKRATLGQIEEAIWRVAGGALAFCPAARAELPPTRRARRSSASCASVLGKLSLREIEVLQ